MFYQALSCGFKEQLESSASGTTISIVNKSKFNDIEVVLPRLSDQQEIVRKLAEAFEGIAVAKGNAEKNLQNAQELFESCLHDLFGMSHPDWTRNNQPLSDLCEFIVDCEHKTAPTQETGIPSIRTTNIGKGKLLLDGVYRVSKDTYVEWTRRAIPMPGDLILGREAPAGNVAVIPEGLRVCLGQRTVLIRPRRDVFLSDFLCALLLHPEVQAKLLAHSRGATVQHVNMKDIRALRIEAIPPLSVQASIVSKIDGFSTGVDGLVSLIEYRLAALDELKKSVLDQAFTGGL